MTRLSWTTADKKMFSGLRKGVLYLFDGLDAVAWSGLVEVSASISDKTQALYLDGTKYFDFQEGSDSSGVIQAYTYPDEFLACEGVRNINGMLVDGQHPYEFDLSYQTLIYSEMGEVVGYKIHLLYSLTVVPATRNNATISKDTTVDLFEWPIVWAQFELNGFRSAHHITIDSTRVHPYLLEDLESMLYGTDNSDPTILRPAALLNYLQAWAPLQVIELGDDLYEVRDHGEFMDVSGDVITITSSGVQQIDQNTYTLVSSWS